MQSESGTLIVAKKGAPPASSENASGKRKPAPRAEQPFDHWLHKQLHEMYDAIAKEPLPDDLLRLIDNDAEADQTPPGSGDKSRKKN
jgi:hypothetical protein